MWTVISGMFGGALRLVPEIFKLWDAKNERKHELDMQKVAYDFQVLKGSQVVEAIREEGMAEYSAGGLDALKSAIEAQARPSGVRWVDALNALIRPLITIQWVVVLYPAVIVTTFVILIQQNVPLLMAMNEVFGPEEKGLVAFIVDFWFVGRVLDAGRRMYARSRKCH